MKRSINHRPSKSRQRSERYRPYLLSLEDRLCLSLTLTQAGQDAGIVLSTFAAGFPNTGAIGPLGIAFPSSGGVLVTDFPGNGRLFATDTDGQSTSSFRPAQNYGGINSATNLAQLNGQLYMAQFTQGRVVQINDDGTLKQVIVPFADR